MTAFGSPGWQALCQQARQLAEAYKIDAVPAMGVQGRYYTNGNLANAGQPAKGPAVGNEHARGGRHPRDPGAGRARGPEPEAGPGAPGLSAPALKIAVPASGSPSAAVIHDGVRPAVA